jgi:multiple sugar transport system permease protein
MARGGAVSGSASLPARPAAPTRRAASGWRQDLVGWGFAAPFLAIFVVFLAIPIVVSLLLSFTDFGLPDLKNPLGTNFVGLANYSALLADPKFLQAAFNTAYFVVAGVPLTLIAALAVAMALNQPIVRFKSFFRVGYYLPVVTSIVAIAVVWRYLLDPDTGLINLALSQIGINGPRWLADPVLAMPAIILMAVWRNLGFSMVIFLAGLQGIPVEYYEAAAIDGANRWQTFRGVTLPLLRPTLLFALVTTSIGYLQLFEEPFVMTAGGPRNQTLSLAMYLYQQGFNFFHQGYAAAIAYILFIAIVVLAVVQFRVLRTET